MWVGAFLWELACGWWDYESQTSFKLIDLPVRDIQTRMALYALLAIIVIVNTFIGVSFYALLTGGHP